MNAMAPTKTNKRHQPGPRMNAVALMGMTRRPTMRSARARLMMNMLDTFNTFKAVED